MSLLLRVALCAAGITVAAGEVRARDSKAAMAYLSEALGDSKQRRLALPALRATKDKDLLPIFVALTRGSDRKMRMFATSSLADIGGPEAAGALRERLWKDPAMAIRVEALLRLLERGAISDKQLVEALQIGDEGVQSVAARALVRRGRGAAAVEALRKLTGSANLTTSSMARLSLLGMGYEKHRAELAKIINNSETDDSVVSLLMGQISVQKIVAAKDLAIQVARSHRPVAVRVKAYRGVCKLYPAGPAMLCKAIKESKSTTLQVYLVRAITSGKDPKKHLAAVVRDNGAAGALARFELARLSGGREAGTAVDRALALGHPIVVDYVLDRAQDDVAADAKSSAYYASALLKFIGGADGDAARMGPEHIRAARAATILIELGSPEAVDGLKKLLAGRYGATTRSVAAGLLRSDSRLACDLARPLLKSPYEELATDAALILGKFSDAGARAHLGPIVQRAQSHRPATVALASWYLLKIAGQGGPAAKALAKEIK